MLTPKEYIGPIMELGQERRGEFKEMNFITENRASVVYELPLAEVIPFLYKIITMHVAPHCNYFHLANKRGKHTLTPPTYIKHYANRSFR
jgi:predicted membrane GTPase involved in stress response